MLLFIQIVHFSAVSNNTLYNNNNWESVKMNLEMPVYGSVAFFVTKRALANNKLDLSTWHAYQEIRLKENKEFSQLKFDFFLEENSILSCFIGKKKNIYYNIEFDFSDNIIRLVTSENYCFKEVKKYHFDYFKTDKNKCIVEISNKLVLYINEKFVFEEEYKFDHYLGFRGGMEKVLIDNIELYNKNGQNIFNDNFFNSYFNVDSVIILAFFFTCIIGVYFLNTGLKLLIYLFYFLNVFSFIGIVYYHKYEKFRYPKESSIDWKGFKSRITSTESCLIKISEDAKGTNSFQKILIVGGSQTWGAGSSNEKFSFSNLLNQKANENNKKFHFINAGISALNSDSLLYFFNNNWIKLKPNFLILNLSNNDRNNKSFLSNLQQFIDVCQNERIKIMFVLEPNSTQNFHNLIENHKIMEDLAKVNNIPLIKMHQYLLNQNDKGYLFWDNVHLTDCGHSFFADYLWLEFIKYYYEC